MNYFDRAQYNLIYLARSVSFHYRFKTTQLDGALQDLVQTVDRYEAARQYYPCVPTLPPEDSSLHPLVLAQKAEDHCQLIQPYCYGIAFRDPERFIENTHIEFSPVFPFRMSTLFVWGIGKLTLTSMMVNDAEQFKNGGGMPGELFESGMTLEKFLKFLTPDIGLGTEATWVPGWKLKSMPRASTSIEMPLVTLGSRIRTTFTGKINALFWIGQSALAEDVRPSPKLEIESTCDQCGRENPDLEAITVGGEAVAHVCSGCKTAASARIVSALSADSRRDHD